MKALTVRQPWASLIATGEKTVEIRSWPTHYRGPLLITASAKIHGAEHTTLPRGCTICTVNLIACRPLQYWDFFSAHINRWPGWQGHYAWVLDGAQPVANHPIKSRLGLWECAVAL